MREQRGLTRIWQSSNCWGRTTKHCIAKFCNKKKLCWLWYIICSKTYALQWKWRESLTAHFVLKITTGVGWSALLSLQVTSNAMWLVFRSDFMMCHNISKMLWQRCDNLTGFAQHRSHKLFLADVERLHPVDEMSMWWFQENGHHWEKHNCWQYGTAVTCQSWWGLLPLQPLWRCSPPHLCKYVIRCMKYWFHF